MTESTAMMNNTTITSCTLCSYGGTIAFPDKVISIPGFDFVNNCQTLASVVPFLQHGSTECDLVQSIGTLCGCPKQEHACNLCSDGSTALYGWRELAFLASSEGLLGSASIVPTCELVEAGLHSYTDDQIHCETSQSMLAEYCGCGAYSPGLQPALFDEGQRCKFCPKSEAVPWPNKTITIDGFPLATCRQIEEAAETLFPQNHTNCKLLRHLSVHCGCEPEYDDPCPICGEDNTYHAPFPDNVIDSRLTRSVFGNMTLSCGILADITQVYSNGADPNQIIRCRALQGIGAMYCGCPLPQEKSSCNFCPHPLNEDDLQITPAKIEPYADVTCELAQATASFVKSGDRFPFGNNFTDFSASNCRFFQTLGFLCGCNDGLYTYWGADTLQKQQATVWIQRTTAMLSIIGSMAIICHILRTSRDKVQIYYRILVSLSCADLLSSIAWGLGPVMIPSDLGSSLGLDLKTFGISQFGFYGASGNSATCTLQGFILHLGFTSILYNVSLSYSYKLSVVDGFRNANFTRWYQILLLIVPAIVGTILACVAIPFVTFTPVGCNIGSYKDEGGWAKIIGLFYLPFGLAFVYIPLNTIYVYWKVRSRNRKGDRWRMSNAFRRRELSLPRNDAQAHRNRMGASSQRLSATGIRTESKVFWQSFWYVVAFFASYTIFVVVFAMDGFTIDSYPLYVSASILTPMQGFFNSIVYFRRPLLRCLQCRKSRHPGNRDVTILQWLSTPLKCLKRVLDFPFLRHKLQEADLTAMQNNHRAFAMGLASSYVPSQISCVEEQGKAMTVSTVSVEGFARDAKIESDSYSQQENISFGESDTVYGLSVSDERVENGGAKTAVGTEVDFNPRDDEREESKLPYGPVDQDAMETINSTAQHSHHKYENDSGVSENE